MGVLTFIMLIHSQIAFKMKPETLSDRPAWNDLECEAEVGQVR